VQYTIASRGRPIGTTDLDFVRILDSNRSGWFHPNSLGETLLPDVALLLPAMRAFVCRNGRDENGQSIVQPDFRSSSQFADLAEAFHRIAAMELTLHHADGTLIPTAQIGIQDTEQLLEFGRLQALQSEPDPLIDDDEVEWDLDVEPALAGDLELPSGNWQPSDDAEDDFDLDEIVRRAYEKLADLPRYQVHVELVNGNAIP